jgi:uncharacterized membrane protein YcaP (DUF421 family)
MNNKMNNKLNNIINNIRNNKINNIHQVHAACIETPSVKPPSCPPAG